MYLKGHDMCEMHAVLIYGMLLLYENVYDM